MSELTPSALDFKITIEVVPVPSSTLLTEAQTALIQSRMDEARDAALDVLNCEVDEPSSPIPATLVDAIATSIRAGKRVAALREMVLTGGGTAPDELAGAVEAFNTAFATLQSHFEQEFPNV